jgi:tripartite-type tricarboxylate transporter receptor subunit TctC
MSYSLSRRRFMQTAIAAAGALGPFAARAAAGRALFGLQPSSVTTLVIEPYLKAIQGHYEPDLGNKVVSVPGNSGGVALEALRTSPADGGTTLAYASSFMTLLPILRTIKTIDPIDDLIPVVSLGEITLAFVVGRTVPESVKTMKDYMTWVKETPMLAIYGVPGLGTGAHFVGAEVARKASFRLRPASYKGMSAIAEDLALGSLPAGVMTVTSALDGQRRGLLRILAVASDQRWPYIPEIPTLIESGAGQFPVKESYGFFMMKQTPPAKVRELGEAVQAAGRTDAIRASLVQASFLPTGTTFESYAASLAEERADWKSWLKITGFSIDS